MEVVETPDTELKLVDLHLCQGKILVWNAHDVKILRETHHIVGSLVGALPRSPRQNTQMGLPLQLMPEEAMVLLVYEAARLVSVRTHKPTAQDAVKIEDDRRTSFMKQQELWSVKQAQKKQELAHIIEIGRLSRKQRRAEKAIKRRLKQEAAKERLQKGGILKPKLHDTNESTHGSIQKLAEMEMDIPKMAAVCRDDINKSLEATELVKDLGKESALQPHQDEQSEAEPGCKRKDANCEKQVLSEHTESLDISDTPTKNTDTVNYSVGNISCISQQTRACFIETTDSASTKDKDTVPCVVDKDTVSCIVVKDTVPCIVDKDTMLCIVDKDTMPCIVDKNTMPCIVNKDTVLCIVDKDTMPCTVDTDSHMPQQTSEPALETPINTSSKSNDSAHCKMDEITVTFSKHNNNAPCLLGEASHCTKDNQNLGVKDGEIKSRNEQITSADISSPKGPSLEANQSQTETPMDIQGSVETDCELKKKETCLGADREAKSQQSNDQGCLIQLFTGTPNLKEDDCQTVEWNYPELPQDILRCRVFQSFWEQGYYLTSGSKFGGDFLVYPGDPFLFHSFYVAVCMPYKQPISPLDIVAFGRMASNVKKTVVLCSVSETDEIIYTSVQWTGIS